MLRVLTTACPVAILSLLANRAWAADDKPDKGRLGIPVVNLQHWYTGTSTVTDPSQPDLRLEAHTLLASALYAHRFERTRTTLVAGARYYATFLAAGLAPAPQRRHVHHAPFVRLAVAQGLNERWGMAAYGMIGIGSDMAGLALRDVRLTVGAAATYRISPRLRLAFGAMYSTVFITPMPLPLFNVHYRRGPLRLLLMVPDRASAWLSLQRWIDVGLVAAVLNLRYGLHAADRFADLYHVLNMMVGPAVRVFVHRGIFVRVDGGYNMRFFLIKRNDATVYSDELFDGYFLSSSVGYLL